MSKKKTEGIAAGKVLDAAQLQVDWTAGVYKCPLCEKPLPLESLPRLQMHPCPRCQKMIFVPEQIGGYFLYEPCGGGGMGSVYKAVSTKFPGRVLAMKVLSRQCKDKPAEIHALLNEARISATFQGCDFVAASLDSGCANGEYFAVMEFIEGERLDKMIDRRKQIPEDELLKLALHILAAEQHIYRCGYLYRDIKPENIIVNPNGYAVLLDFGLCMPRTKAAGPSTEEFVSGSPYYLPPERLQGTGETAASEIYSLGMLIYYALTGKTYYDASEVEELAQRHLATLRVNSVSKMEGVRPSLSALLDSMIRQNPKDRPQSFHEVAEAIKAILKEIKG